MLKTRGRTAQLLMSLAILLNLSSCATSGRGEDERDPWERYNRAMYNFNSKLDRAVLKPIAVGYSRVLPSPVRRGVYNFFNNLFEPTTAINALLQGKVNRAAVSSGRFLANTTFGLLGVIDAATFFGLERRREDFGQTLAVWGFPQGPYLVLPLLGPSTVRDGIGLIPFYAYTDLRSSFDGTGTYLAVAAVNVIDTRAGLLRAERLLDLQLDPYVFTRETYLQQRRNLIYDGVPPEEEYDDEEYDE